MIQPNDIIDYWFSKEISQYWFSSTPTIDAEMKQKFNDLWESAQQGKLDAWQESAEGCLALCIILDQFPLNMFRGTVKSFSTEQQSILISKHAINKGFDEEITQQQLAFLYMPLMHSENLKDQDLAVQMFEKVGLEGNLRFAKHHRDLIKEFGRFPHRNEILGRENTLAEIDYLKSKRAFSG